MLRSLAVCLKTLPAKKAALQWAEQQLQADNNGTDRHRLLGQWKKHFQEFELKATVAARKKERAKVPKQKRKDRLNARKKENILLFQQGQAVEKELLEKNFDMRSRRVFEPRASASRGDEANSFQLDDGDDDDDDMTEGSDPSLVYPDDFEDDANEDEEAEEEEEEEEDDWHL
jgi:hypothetical protein